MTVTHPRLKGLVSRILARLALPRVLAARTGYPTILCYHRVVEEWEPILELAVSVAAFEAQIAHLVQRWEILSLEDMDSRWRRGAPLPPRSVAVTFDDGYEDNYRWAFPILKRYGIPATLFVITGHMGFDTPFWWDRAAALYRGAAARGRIGDVMRRHGITNVPPAGEWVRHLRTWDEAKREALLGDLEAEGGAIAAGSLPGTLRWDQIREMAESGIAIGSHTRTHPDLTRVDPQTVEGETGGSKTELDGHLGRPVRFFAYPFGYWNHRVREAVAQAGYALAVAGQDGVPSRHSLPRRRVREGHTWDRGSRFSPALFEAEISGALDYVLLRRSRQ